jgi:hypothetical protein
MTKDASLLGQLRALFHLPTTLSKTKHRILEAEKASPDRIGTWKCNCSHNNAIYHLRELAVHPLGLLQCRACPLSWHPSIAPKITSPDLYIQFHSVQSTISDTARVLPPPRNACTSYGYICLGYSCGLSWRTEIQTEWFSGKTRRVLFLDGRRAKLQCDCGVKIFEAGRYVVFGIVPRSSVGLGVFAANAKNDACRIGRVGSVSSAVARNDSGLGRRTSSD